MSRKEIMQKITFVVFGENSWRIWLEQKSDGRWCLYFDAHGLNVQQAKKMLKNVIAIAPCEIELAVIHGFHNGTAIKHMIHNEGRKDLGYRLIRVSSPWNNPGVSNLQIAPRLGSAA